MVRSDFGSGNTQALDTVLLLNRYIETENDLTINFTQYTENNPFNNLILANSIRNYKENYPRKNISVIPKKNDGYLQHLGFYNMIGMDYGNKVGEANSTSNYVPITKITFDYNFYNTIENKSRELANLLKFDKDLSKFLAYSFIEAIRNVYEHAETDTVYIAAQKWPTMNLAEIAIVDSGCGIAKALGKRYPGKNDKQLMYLAALPGVSAQSNHSYLEKDDGWRNSGYGLYALRRLSNIYGGSFLLCSGKIALHQIQGRNATKYDTFYEGTAISIRFKTDQKFNFNQKLNHVICEGQEKAKRIKDAIKHASKSSGGKYQL